jgi:hypothetical protein
MKSLFVKWIGLAVLALSFQATHAMPVENLRENACVIIPTTETELYQPYYCEASVESMYEIGWLVVGVKKRRARGSTCFCSDLMGHSIPGVEGILLPSRGQFEQYWKFKTSHLVNW